ncbi:ABC transporter ATP-binding protein [Cutibacterium sp.]|uniref:ATP-binding cassette domain-containing protein n=1 Tax=Cutibacterium sp. TaxID=1912221 RepID=UPI0026DC5CAF|nr:ABC transporter ATP-binding protein [Cutibacterium sp.]MDO4412248.1 ABC transporter ATP-binding protein [Cutibacterium sp.]
MKHGKHRDSFVRPVFRSAAPYAVVAVISGILEAVFLAWQPGIIQEFVDSLASNAIYPSVIYKYLGSVAGILVFELAYQCAMVSYKSRAIRELRDQVIRSKCESFRGAQTDTQVAQTTAIITNDVPIIYSEYFQQIIVISICLAKVVAFATALITLGWQYLLVVVVMAMLALVVPMVFKKHISAARTGSLRTTRDYVSSASEYLSGLFLLRIYGQHQKWFSRLSKSNDIATRVEAHHGYIMAHSNVTVGAIQFGGRIALLVVGAILVQSQRGTIGGLVASFQLADLFVQPLLSLVNAIIVFTGGVSAVKSLARGHRLGSAVYNEGIPNSASSHADKVPANSVGKILVKSGTVTCSDGHEIPIPEVVFDTRLKTHLRGPNGSGKSTVLKILSRQLDYAPGFELDGVQATQEDLVPWLYGVALVPQYPVLFTASLRENITLGRSIPDAQVMEVLQVVRGTSPSMLNESLDKILDPEAMSGGERQRVALARALAGNPSFLLLDEPLSMVDVASRRTILQRLMADRRFGMLYISHDETGVTADAVVSM